MDTVSAVPSPIRSTTESENLQADLWVDCHNLANECQSLLRALEVFAFPNTGLFILEQYEAFLRNRRVPDYLDGLRQLANKVHGLKGMLGFLILEGKQLCHHAEEIIKPLAQVQLVLDDRLHALLTRFVYEIQALLENHGRTGAAAVTLGDWPARIEQAHEDAQAFVEDSAERMAALLAERSRDDGSLRKRDVVSQISVSREGFEELVEHIHQLYGVIAELGAGTSLQRAGRAYNGFLEQHQRIKKLPLDVSRYERLVPSLAERYGLRARFLCLDPGVRADHEFWSTVHEIANHTLKNAVIHGLEPTLERLRQDKDEVGTIRLELREDLLSIALELADDGRGIDPDRIARKALDAGIVSAERLAAMSREEVLGLVFEQGVTTLEQADDNAGRGIGMNAVREAMERHGGTCRIDSELGRGTVWAFHFPKANVSLPCFVVRIGDYDLAVPEAHVRAFANFDPARLCTVQGRPVYRHEDLLVPIADNRTLFGAGIQADRMRPRRLLVVQDGGAPCALVINEVLDKGLLPLQPLEASLAGSGLFIGATLHQVRPVLVLSVRTLHRVYVREAARL